ncbi:unnamed protein product [Adineta steineri]|uniref:adenosine kinase n=1 Tax=Adineta steineri TaxID=433720 RepID=A0A815CPI5_9BILA|nr:unnamed protein product [Adineta steineri]CAF1286373.1 unnamed protein product [Adineta steineri]
METSNVMKQNQHYNLNSAPQLAIIHKSFSYIQKAVEEHKAKFSSTDIFFIVDYGCAHGANSFIAIQAIIKALTQKYGLDIENQISVIYNDLPQNDWSAVFQVASQSSVTSLASGKSFYQQILPSNTVQFGYTSSATHWLSKKPCNLREHCYALGGKSSAEELKLWSTQAAEDYRLFLQHRSNELKKGAVLACVNPSRIDVNDTGILPIFHTLYRSAVTVLDEDELLNYNILVYYRSLEQETDPTLLKELNLELICADLHLLENPIYQDYYQKNINLEEFIEKYTEFVRSWSESSLLRCLREDRTKEEQIKISEEFWNEFRNGVRLQGAEPFKHNPYQSTCSQAVLKLAEHAEKKRKIFAFNLSAEYICEKFGEEIMKLLPLVDFLFGNEQEAKCFAQHHLNIDTNTTITHIAEELQKKLSKSTDTCVIITRGADSIVLASKNGVKMFTVKRPPKIIDTIGCGDAFVGGFLAYWSLNTSIDDCINAACYCAYECLLQTECQFSNPSSFNPTKRYCNV